MIVMFDHGCNPGIVEKSRNVKFKLSIQQQHRTRNAEWWSWFELLLDDMSAEGGASRSARNGRIHPLSGYPTGKFGSHWPHWHTRWRVQRPLLTGSYLKIILVEFRLRRLTMETLMIYGAAFREPFHDHG